jgi:4-diphosphocytidyl-2-C-methyl-D-erythritol kinase
MSVHVTAYAKLNLALRVLGPRTDGYHEILSEVQTIDLSDRLTIDLGGQGVRAESDLVLREENIVARAAAALLRRKGLDQGVHIFVEKGIPIGAGLGGGSSDAAAVLRVFDRLTPPELSFDALCEVGAAIGSDVPLFLHGGRVRMAGRGEHVQRLPGRSAEYFLVLVPPVHCSTGAIYARWDAIASTGCTLRDDEPRRGENDLLAAALDVHRDLAPYHDAVGSLDADYYGMSGSGSSFFAAFSKPAIAERARASLKRQFESANVVVCRPTTTGHQVQEES